MKYCNKCGTANDDSALYCSNDGFPLKTVEMNLEVERNESQFCGQCGHKNNNTAIYCSNCGNTLEKVSEKAKVTTPVGTKSVETPSVQFTKVTELMKPGHMKTALFGALIAIIVVIVGTFIVSKLSQESVLESFEMFGAEDPTEVYEEFLYEAEDYMNIDPDDINPFSTVNLIMNSHMIKQHFVVQEEDYYDYGINFDFNTGLFLYIFIPILALFFAGYFVKTRNEKYTVTDKLKISLAIGIVYGLFLGIVSFIAGFSYNFSEYGSSIEIAYDFSFFDALFTGIILGFFFSFLGAYKKNEDNVGLNYGKYVQTSSAAFLKVFAVIGVITSVVTYFLITDNLMTRYMFDGTPFIGMLLIFAQLSIYVLNIVMFNSFKISAGDGGSFREEAKFNLLGGSSGSDAEQIFGFLDEKLIYLYLLAIVAAAIFVWIGKKFLHGDVIKSTIIFGAIFAFLFTFISINATILVKGVIEGDFGELVVGFTVVQTFITSFLFSGIFSFLGAKYLSK